jgi:hypothetical protein
VGLFQFGLKVKVLFLELLELLVEEDHSGRSGSWEANRGDVSRG